MRSYPILTLTTLLVLAASFAARAEDDETGFISLFDGKTLNGWQGSVDGYAVEDGAIYCVPSKGGFLYTKEQYGDFILRFEFQLTPGANNGIGIRAPLEGNPAFAGIEIQVIDNTAEKYAKLKEWQYHGSVYGVVAAKRGHLRPVGEWNEQEIVCRGDHIVVKLNGVTIVDANIREASTPRTLDGQAHPGLDRTEGHICFCGHGDRVGFRHLRVKPLK